MKKSLIILVLVLISCGHSRAQTNYLNSRFALISTTYKMHCIKCRDISNSLFNQMKSNSIFNVNDQYPNWIVAKNSNNLSRKYRGVNFFLTSTVEQNEQNYKITFTMYNPEGAPYISENFVQIIKSSQLHVDIEKVANIVLQEVNFFKSNGQFKSILLVDDFEIMSSTGNMSDFKEKFSDWLANELRKHDVLSLKYHVYYHKDFSKAEIENKLDGNFYPQADSKFKMKMVIELLGDQKPCKILTIDIIEYENKNKNEILNEIITTINKLEERN